MIRSPESRKTETCLNVTTQQREPRTGSNSPDHEARPPPTEPDAARFLTRDPRMWALRGSMFLILLGMGVSWVYAGIWMKENGLGETAIGSLIGLGGALAAGMGLFWGWLSDHTGRSTPIVSAGCLLTGASLIVLAHSRTVAGFALFEVLVAAGASATMTVMPLLALAVIGEERRGAGYGRFRVFGSVGYLIGLYFLAARVTGLERLFLVAGLILLLGAVPLVVANVRTRRHVERHGFGGLLKHPGFCWCLVAVFFFSLGNPAVFAFLAMYAREIGMTQAGVARLMGMCGLTALVALPLMGSISDRIGPRRVLLVAFAAMPVRILLQAVAGGTGGLYAAQLLHFFTWAGPEVTIYVYLTQLVGEQDKGIAVSALVTTRTLSQLVGNPIAGYLAEHWGYRNMFFTMACVSALGLVTFCCTSLRRPIPRPGVPGEDRDREHGGAGHA